MEGKGMYTILLSIVAVLALAMAVLVVFLFVIWNPNPGVPEEKTSEESKIEPVVDAIIPPDQLNEFAVFGEDGKYTISLKDEPEHPGSVLMCSISIKYDVGVKRKNEEEHKTIVETMYGSEIREAITNYIGDLTYSDARMSEAKIKAKEDLKKALNDIINQGVEERKEIIYKIIFDRWDAM